MSGKKQKKARFIKPPNLFKQKVGSGGIDQTKLEKAETYIQNTEVDFKPYAETFLKELVAVIKEVQESQIEFSLGREKIIKPILNLKANGAMFKYRLISDVADIMMHFLESIQEFNKDAYAVLIVHQNTLNAIVINNLKGAGGKEGHGLVIELEKACKRYFDKYNIEP